MPSLSERNTLRLRAIPALAAIAACLWLAGCGSSSSTPPPPPPAPIGHAYITTAGNLFGYSIAASNGALTAVALPGGAPGGSAIASNAQKNLLYTLTSGGQISGYTFNRSDGSLTPIAGGPWGGAGVGVAFLTVDTAGQNLFVPANQDLVVVPFAIGSTGALTIGLQVGTPAAPVTATVDPAGHFLYVPMGATGTELYQITGDALTDLGTIPPLTGGGSVYIAINPADTFAYVSDGVKGVVVYSINATTGELTPLAGSPFTAAVGPSTLAMTPNGRFLYVATAAAVVGFAINPDGSLTALAGPITFSQPPLGMSIDPTGSYLYVLSLNTAAVSILHIDPNTGILTAQPALVTVTVPTGITTTP